LSTPTFSPRADEDVDGFVHRFGARSHEHDHALGGGWPTYSNSR
jgi:hypothetical protein